MPAGRPRKFQDLEELQEKIDKYFADCDEGEIPYTITGLAMELQSSRKALLDIESNYPEEFVNTIKQSKLKIENDYEIALRKTGRAGDIFGLKNFGWKDQQNVKLEAEVKHEASQDLLDTIAELLS